MFSECSGERVDTNTPFGAEHAQELIFSTSATCESLHSRVPTVKSSLSSPKLRAAHREKLKCLEGSLTKGPSGETTPGCCRPQGHIISLKAPLWPQFIL